HRTNERSNEGTNGVILRDFFFQAEDGIRDFHVTGVQTCALPIWLTGWRWPGRCGAPATWPGTWPGTVPTRRCRWPRSCVPCFPRSEERREGKEGQMRGQQEVEEQIEEEVAG